MKRFVVAFAVALAISMVALPLGTILEFSCQ